MRKMFDFKKQWTIVIILLLSAGITYAAWDKTQPDDDELLEDLAGLLRANWEAIETGTTAALQITNAKVATGAAIDDAKLATINDAGKVSGTALTGLASTPSGAGVIPDANLTGKMKADSYDTTPQYLDGLIDTAMFQISAGDLLQLKDSGVGTEKLVNGSSSPGNSKYYGTNSGGTKGFFDLTQDHGGLTGLADDDHTQYLTVARHDADDHSGLTVSEPTIAASAVSQSKLKTSTGEISHGNASTVGTYQNNILPGGSYGFYPQVAATDDSRAYVCAQIFGHDMGTSGGEHPPATYTTYVTTMVRTTNVASGTIYGYVQQRYVTASGNDHWIFLLVNKSTRETVASYQAPDHPCVGNGGDETVIKHPFGDIDDALYEVVLVDNSILTEIKNKITPQRSMLTIINEDYKVDDSSAPKYEAREIIEIDETGSKRGEVIAEIDTPDWAKIKISADKFTLKKREVKNVPAGIIYKKLKER